MTKTVFIALKKDNENENENENRNNTTQNIKNNSTINNTNINITAINNASISTQSLSLASTIGETSLMTKAIFTAAKKIEPCILFVSPLLSLVV